MIKLGDKYSKFSRIDLDLHGGYARVAQVRTHGHSDYPEHCAFKLMRNEIDYDEGIERFEDELNLLVDITRDKNAPSAITRIFDSGFAPVELAQCMYERNMPDPELKIVSTGKDPQRFLDEKSALKEKEPGDWLPYLVVELAPFDDSLFRQIRQQYAVDPSGLYRLPTGEVISMAIQLLEVMDYLRTEHRRVYMDWKPEHIFWGGLNSQVKLVDWNVTMSIDDNPGEKQNIQDDLRLFCGAVLYIGLTFIDPDDPEKPIGPHPTTDLKSPVSQIRRRYWTDKPNFYQRDASLDENIKKIIQKGLDPMDGFITTSKLKKALLNYAQREFGITEEELMLRSEPSNPYFKALIEMRLAQQQLLDAQGHLIEAVGARGNSLEFTRLFDVIKHALTNFPAS